MGTAVKDTESGAVSPVMGCGIDNKKILSGSFTFSSSYATGGEALDLSNELKSVDRVIIGSFPVIATVASVKYDDGMLLAYVAAGTEVAATTDLSTVVIEYIAIGLA